MESKEFKPIDRALLSGWTLGLAEKLGDGEQATPEDVTMLYRVSRLLAQDANTLERWEHLTRGKVPPLDDGTGATQREG